MAEIIKDAKTVALIMSHKEAQFLTTILGATTTGLIQDRLWPTLRDGGIKRVIDARVESAGRIIFPDNFSWDD